MLIAPLESSIEFQNIIKGIENKRYPIGIYGASESGRGYIIDGIFENIDKSMIIVAQSDMEAKNLYEDLILYTNEVYYFPVKEMVFYSIDAISGDLRWERLKVINEILNEKKKIIVTAIDSFAAQYTPHKLFLEYSMKLKEGDEVNLTEISKTLVQSGYERVEMVDGKGKFSVRGGILDVFPTCSTYPYRVELFGDEIESIRAFNTESQRSIEKVKKLDVFPAKEIIISEETTKLGSDNLEKSLIRLL
jgi:transcription-repair coupling factor (superfamily II helicase)